MKYKLKSLKFNAILNGLRQSLNFIYPLITFPYISRVLSVNSVGIYNFSNTYVGYFTLLAALGIATYAVREGAKYRDDKVRINTFVSQVFTLNILSTVLSYILLILTLFLFKGLHPYIMCILIFSLQIIFTTIGTEWIYIIYEDYTYITVRSIIFKLLSLALLFIFVKEKNDFLAYAGVTVFATVGSNLLNYIHAKSFTIVKITKNVNLRKHLKPSLVIFLSSVAVTLYVSSDTTILGFIKGNHAVGIYSTATKIYMIVVQLIAAILMVTIPRLSMLFGKKQMVKYREVLNSLFNLMVIIIIPVAIGLVMLAKEIILLIGGKKYISATIPLQILAIAIIFTILNTIVSNCILIPSKRENKLFLVNLITGVFNVFINFLLIPHWSYIAAAITTVCSEGMSMTLNMIVSRDILRNIFINNNFLINLFQTGIGSICISILCFIIKALPLNSIFTIILSTFLSMISYLVLLLLMNNKIIKENLKLLKK